MKLVIDIPEEAYKEIHSLKYLIHGLKSEENRQLFYQLINAIQDGTPLPKHHGRLIDADRFADRIKEVSVNNKYDKLQLGHLTVADVLDAITHDLKGTSLNGFELCPTVIEADKEGE